MHTHIALLRAVNVGGTGKLPMADLRDLCQSAGFGEVRTYIASGNVVLRSASTEKHVKAVLEKTLAHYAGKPVGVMVRSASALAQVIQENPFPKAAPNRVVVVFLDEAPPANALSGISGMDGEEVVLGRREIYVHYGEGMARSRLKIPAARAGTGRNLNTIAKLVEMSRAE